MAAFHKLPVTTREHTQLVDVTGLVQREVGAAGLREGVVTLFVPHTTAGITIQENADPDVVRDLIVALERAVPWESRDYRHGEGNTAAHVKASLMGSSAQVFVRDGDLALGTWQAIYFCEFDGPRSRELWLRVS
ncbi:MAG: secondary thiamine-phosphate synthase enzyme YjbQ [Verrucomicrobia bacterium]|nr:secondary thiamine-phosphate synthase enzyme YjbQ [Verrucomicrobiota bacterium]